MKLTRIRIHRALGVFTIMAAATLLAALSAPQVRAQPANSSVQFKDLMKMRQELSIRAIEETRRRRFEEGKSESAFPSDSFNRKGGVVTALTPEQQKALRHNERGLELFSKGKLEAAMKEYQEAIRFDAKLAAAHNNLGSVHFAAARFEEAAAAFRHACELDADYGQAFFNLALAQIRLGHQKDANETLDGALRAYISAGGAHFSAGRFKEAEEAFRGMLQIDPEYIPALLRLGLVYNALGRYEEAAQNIRRVIGRQPKNALAHEILGEALYGGQKYEEAVASAEHALKLTPDSPEAHHLAGLARASLGQRDAALTHVARLQELKSPDLAQQLSEFINKKIPPK
ncbi:MAG TPA: tetratricopeptide repeat protein [Pyrinomonadaceae bacterium]|nr:tetratricopeptide repeat protein [Pyrinomonadaceae bacterium]